MTSLNKRLKEVEKNTERLDQLESDISDRLTVGMIEDILRRLDDSEKANARLNHSIKKLDNGIQASTQNNTEIVELVKAVFNVLSMQVIHGAQSWEAIPENCLSPQQLKLLKVMGLLENPTKEG